MDGFALVGMADLGAAPVLSFVPPCSLSLRVAERPMFPFVVAAWWGPLPGHMEKGPL